MLNLRIGSFVLLTAERIGHRGNRPPFQERLSLLVSVAAIVVLIAIREKTSIVIN
jgi:hypothetical protein